jgi:hypothetical protein
VCFAKPSESELAGVTQPLGMVVINFRSASKKKKKTLLFLKKKKQKDFMSWRFYD